MPTPERSFQIDRSELIMPANRHHLGGNGIRSIVRATDPRHWRALPPELAALARSQTGALQSRQIYESVGRCGFERLLEIGTIRPLWHGVYYAPECIPDQQTNFPDWSIQARADDSQKQRAFLSMRLAAAELTLGGPAIACHHTAAQWCGFDVVGDEQLHVLSPNTSVSVRKGLVLHRFRHDEPLMSVAGRTIVDAPTTAVRLAALSRQPGQALAILDAALRSRHIRNGRDDLHIAAHRLKVPGLPTVRRLIPLADGRAESPPESELRLMIMDSDLPAPEIQYRITLPSGRHFRADLAWPAVRIAIEYDGVEFHTGSALARDRERMTALARLGWLVVHVTAGQLYRRPGQLIDALRADLSTRTH